MNSKTTLKSYRILTGFIRGKDSNLNNLTLGVIDALTNHPVFQQLPVSLADLAHHQQTFQAAGVESRKGGRDRTQTKIVARQVLEDALLQVAYYIQGIARHDRDLMLSSGFAVGGTNHRPGPLDTPGILDLLNNVSGQLVLRGRGVVNARMYEAEASTDGGQTWQPLGKFNGARRMVLSPLTPGVVHQVRFRALGGSTGQSAWSQPVAKMAT